VFREDKLRKVNIHEKYTELQNTRITENIRIQKTKLVITKAKKLIYLFTNDYQLGLSIRCLEIL